MAVQPRSSWGFASRRSARETPGGGTPASQRHGRQLGLAVPPLVVVRRGPPLVRRPVRARIEY